MDLIFSKYFLKQWQSYDEPVKNKIRKKLERIRTNPFSFPKIAGYRFVFKINLHIEHRNSRLMYVVFEPDKSSIKILGIFDRKFGYRDFKKVYKKYQHS